MFNDFLNLCIFSLFVISIINRLISDDGDFVCCRVISEMQHALETRLPFYKWRYEYLLNLSDRMAMMKAMPLKVECSNKINPLLHPYFCNIRGHRDSIFEFFNGIRPLRGGGCPTQCCQKKFENPQIKSYIKYWENECRTSSFTFFLDQSQHTTQQAVIKSNKGFSKCLDDQGIKQKIWYL